MNKWVRDNIEDFVRAQICECATPLHSFVEKHVEYSLSKTIQCLSYHQQYALTRLRWYEEKARHPDVDEFLLDAWDRMCSISNEAFEKKLKLWAFNELIDLGALRATCGSWSCSVRETAHDNWHSCSVVVGDYLYWLNSGLLWMQRKCILNPDWEKATYNTFNTVVKRRVGKKEAPCEDTPILAMLSIAVANCFKDRTNC